MATILAHIQVKPGQEAAFERIAAELAEASWKEPGCRSYEYLRGADPGHYYCLLAFDNFHAFLVHQTSDHHETASPRLGELVEDIRLEWVDAVGGASTFPPTKMQALPEDADELTKRYHRVFAATVQEWWNCGGGPEGP